MGGKDADSGSRDRRVHPGTIARGEHKEGGCDHRRHKVSSPISQPGERPVRRVIFSVRKAA
jgi:hypothetical protein